MLPRILSLYVPLIFLSFWPSTTFLFNHFISFLKGIRLVTSHGLVSQNAPLISLFGKHVVMVPPGKIAKAQIANNLIFLGQGI